MFIPSSVLTDPFPQEGTSDIGGGSHRPNDTLSESDESSEKEEYSEDEDAPSESDESSEKEEYSEGEDAPRHPDLYEVEPKEDCGKWRDSD